MDRGSAGGYQRVPGSTPGETTGSRRAVGEFAGPGEVTGSRTGSRPAGPGLRAPGETTGSRRAITAEAADGRRAPVGAGAAETTGSRRAIAGASETTGSRRAVGESTGYRRAGTGESTGSSRILGADGRPQLGRRRAGASESTGSHRVTPPGEATGSHRVVGETKRGIAKWPLVAGGFVVLLVLGLLAWGWAGNIVNSRAEAQAAACPEGDSNLSVATAPSVAPAVTAAAERWNQAKTVVHAHCVQVHVQAIDDQRVLLALTGRGNVDSIGGQPAVWIPETTAAITELTTARPTLLTSPAESVATTATADYPCAVLTTDDVDEVQQRAAQAFRNYLQEPAQKADFARVLTPGA
ncbi:substrate-binding domain-containing protein [Amycolatopsis thermophila]|uniref:Extracellular solute-binding protein n=1 Tax=Amycolatopsis thermophila TaxID=206084 RepID=A0ABU0F422_9PSEU|nr:substrate-binding domain-containing protein [Amycolatopsis thermophila]MDQ0381835.1 hypothetical protein [Amycolatopsis thermophila]